MFSNDLKNEMKKKFNLSDSIINSSRHYKIPRFVYRAKSIKHQKKNFNFFGKNKIVPLRNYLNDKSVELNKLSRTQYFERKRENMNKLLSQIQREKIDLLINRAYHNINDNIREYNTSISIPKREYKMKLDYLPLVQKEIIIDHVMNRTQKYLPLINKKYEFMKYGNKEHKPKINDEEKKNRQLHWSRNFLEQKKLEEYRKIYKVKYLHSEERQNNIKFKDEFIQKDSGGIENDRYIYSIVNNRNSAQSSFKKSPTLNNSMISFSENQSINPKKKFK